MIGRSTLGMSHHHEQANQHHRGSQPPRRHGIHRKWWFWAAVVLMLGAMAIYVMTMDEALGPAGTGQQVPAAQ
jgi:hypothetical protein